jgi:hypothetical protein
MGGSGGVEVVERNNFPLKNQFLDKKNKFLS